MEFEHSPLPGVVVFRPEPVRDARGFDRRHDPREDLTIAWDDPELGVAWPLPPGMMSEGDRSAPRLAELTDRRSQRPNAGAAG